MDDVRAVAASCLIPITKQIVESLSEDVGSVLDVLWTCLGGMKDDLGASVGSVMELLGMYIFTPVTISETSALGKFISFPQVIELLSSSATS